ncbi:MAG: HypC/HybG/HupF family hydrogenase formation chaperone [Candidatus Kariarchaeaceae archaeon]|jgi:hydrogenase expression/formation protein HypC
MCIAIPNKILKITENMAQVEFGEGEVTDVDISLVDVIVGDYVIVQNGFAIEMLSEDDAMESIEIYRTMLQNAKE